jgi:uncharacterized protein YpiB (UPF0302 family)
MYSVKKKLTKNIYQNFLYFFAKNDDNIKKGTYRFPNREESHMYEKQYPHEGAILFNQTEEKNSYGPMAEKVLAQAIFQFQKQKLMEKIDEALIARNKTLFFELSAQYNELLKKYGA